MVSKRTRGSARTSQRRPGARPPTSRSSTSRSRLAGERRSSAAESQLELAPEIAEASLDEKPAPPAATAPAPTSGRSTTRAARSTQPRSRVKPGSLLAARAATEYLYVAQDMKRILLVAGALFGVMAILYFLLVVARVVPLPFY